MKSIFLFFITYIFHFRFPGKENYKSAKNLKTKSIVFLVKFSSLVRYSGAIMIANPVMNVVLTGLSLLSFIRTIY